MTWIVIAAGALVLAVFAGFVWIARLGIKAQDDLRDDQ